MASWDIIEELVSAAVRRHPLPEAVDELDAQTKRRIIAEAERLGITPQALLSAMRAKQEDDAAQGEMTTGIAAEVGARR